ncbi:MAG: OmpA family protein [Chitinophagaceae bacterium]
MSQLLETLKGLATNQIVSAAAKHMGESENGITKALGGLLPTILGGMLNSNSNNHSVIGDLLGKAGGNTNLITDLVGGFAGGQTDNNPSLGLGSSLIKGIFGDKVGGLVNLISNFSGTKSSSSNSLLSLAGTLIASFLGKKMLGEGLNLGGIMNWLGGSRKEIESAIPAGFSSYLTSSEPSSRSASTASSSSLSSSDDNSGGGMKWLLPLLLLGLLGLGIWYFMKGCNKSEDGVATDTTTAMSSDASSDQVVVDAMGHDSLAVQADASASTNATAGGSLDADGNWITVKGDPKKIKLDNGVEIDATKGSLEDKFHSFIKDPNAVAGKDIWFNFEDLLFDTGKSTLKASSQKQLDNAVEILKAYPNVKIKLGGYTDNTGDSTANVKLSDSRAKTVYNQMMNKGVAKTSFEDKAYEGYGPQHPVADNATPEGRAQNRRISLSVRAK